VQVLAREIARRMLKAQAVKVNSLLQVLLILALVDLGGFPAIVFGPPLAAMIHVLYANLLAANSAGQPSESALDLLVERLERLRAESGSQSLELTSILQRSDDLIRQAREILDSGNGQVASG